MLSRFRIRVLLSCGLLAGGIFFSLCTRPIRIPDQPEIIPVPAATRPMRSGWLSGGYERNRCCGSCEFGHRDK